MKNISEMRDNITARNAAKILDSVTKNRQSRIVRTDKVLRLCKKRLHELPNGTKYITYNDLESVISDLEVLGTILR